MPDIVTTGSSAADGGIAGGIVMLITKFILKWTGREGISRGELRGAIAASEDRTRVMAEELKKSNDKKVEETAMKLALMEHQKGCIADLMMEIKTFQVAVLTSIKEMTTTNHNSFERVHTRIDELKDQLLRKV